MLPAGRILIVDGEGGECLDSLASLLPQCRLTLETSRELATRYFVSSPLVLVILNHSENVNCLNLLSLFRALRPSISVIILTSSGSETLAVQVFRAPLTTSGSLLILRIWK